MHDMGSYYFPFKGKVYTPSFQFYFSVYELTCFICSLFVNNKSSAFWLPCYFRAIVIPDIITAVCARSNFTAAWSHRQCDNTPAPTWWIHLPVQLSLHLLATGGALIACSMPQNHSASCQMNSNDRFNWCCNDRFNWCYTDQSAYVSQREAFGQVTASDHVMHHQMVGSHWVYETGSLTGWQQGSTLGSRSSTGRWTSTQLTTGVLRQNGFALLIMQGS